MRGNVSRSIDTVSRWRDALEHRRLEHVGARVDPVGRRLARAAASRRTRPPRRRRGSGTTPNADGSSTCVSADRGLGAALVVERDERAEVEVGEHVAVAHDEPLVDALGREADAAGGAERLVLDRVAQLQVAEAIVGEVRRRTRRAGSRARAPPRRRRGAPSQVELALEERQVGDRQERLRRGVGERAEAGALAADEDDRLHGVALAVPAGHGVDAGGRRDRGGRRRHGGRRGVDRDGTASLAEVGGGSSLIWLNAVHASGGNASSAPLGRK